MKRSLKVALCAFGGVGYESVWLYGYGGDDKAQGDADGCA